MASNRARKIDKHRQFMGNKMMDDINLFNEISSSPFYDRSKIQKISLMDVANISTSWLQVKSEYLDICEANVFLASRKFGEKNVAERLDIILEYKFQQLQNSFKPVVIEMPAVKETISTIDYLVSSDNEMINVEVLCVEIKPPLESPDMVLPTDTISPVINNFSEVIKCKHHNTDGMPNINFIDMFGDNDKSPEFLEIRPSPDVPFKEQPISELKEPELELIESHDLGKKHGLIKKSSIPVVYIDSSAKSGTFVKCREKWKEELKAICLPPIIRLLVDDQPERKHMQRLMKTEKPIETFFVDSEKFMTNNSSQHYHAHNYGGRNWKEYPLVTVTNDQESRIADGFFSNLTKCSITELLRYRHLIKGYIDGYAAHICYVKKILPFDDKPPWGKGMASVSFLS